MADLKKLLGEELAKQVEEKLGETKLGVVNDGTWIPKTKFDELNDSVKDYKQQITDRDKQFKDLSSKAAGNEELTKQIQDLQEANKQAAADYEAKIAQREFDYALESAIKGSKVHNVKAAKALLELDKVSLKDGKLEGLDDQLEALKTSDPYLFPFAEEPLTKMSHLTHTPGNTTPPTEPSNDPFAAAFAKFD